MASSACVVLHGYASIERLLASCFSGQVTSAHGCSSCLLSSISLQSRDERNQARCNACLAFNIWWLLRHTGCVQCTPENQRTKFCDVGDDMGDDDGWPVHVLVQIDKMKAVLLKSIISNQVYYYLVVDRPKSTRNHSNTQWALGCPWNEIQENP